MKAVPRNNNIFVVQREAVEKTDGGLFIPEISKKRPSEGVIVALGPDIKDENLKVGTRVIYGPYAPHHLRVNIDFGGEEKEACVMTEEDIIAVIDEE